MPGHRRISDALFLRFANDPPQVWKVAALLSMDRDEYAGGLLPIAAYARIFGKSRTAVRALILEWKTHKNDCYNATERDTCETVERQREDTPKDTRKPATAGTSAGPEDTREDSRKTPERHPRDTILEQEQNPTLQGEGFALEPAERSKPRRRRPETVCPPELAPQDRRGALELAALHGKPATPEALDFAWAVFSAWAESSDARRRNWAAAFRKAVAQGWVFEGFGAADPTLSPEQRKAERVKQAAREAVSVPPRSPAIERLASGGLALLDGGR